MWVTFQPQFLSGTDCQYTYSLIWHGNICCLAKAKLDLVGLPVIADSAVIESETMEDILIAAVCGHPKLYESFKTPQFIEMYSVISVVAVFVQGASPSVQVADSGSSN